MKATQKTSRNHKPHKKEEIQSPKQPRHRRPTTTTTTLLACCLVDHQTKEVLSPPPIYPIIHHRTSNHGPRLHQRRSLEELRG